MKKTTCIIMVLAMLISSFIFTSPIFQKVNATTIKFKPKITSVKYKWTTKDKLDFAKTAEVHWTKKNMNQKYSNWNVEYRFKKTGVQRMIYTKWKSAKTLAKYQYFKRTINQYIPLTGGWISCQIRFVKGKTKTKPSNWKYTYK